MNCMAKRTLNLIATIIALVASVSASIADPTRDLELASRYFQEAKWIGDDDNGSLWGKNLYGPIVFVNPASREVFCNEKPPLTNTEQTAGVFVGKLPEIVLVANTALDWGGRRWSMILWPLPENRNDRAQLMMHELWHRIQPEIGLQSKVAANAHLDVEAGRLWLQLEIRALSKALLESDPARRASYAHDAMIFRTVRQRMFAGSKAEEDTIERNEGLAEYTGILLRGGGELESRLWQGRQLQEYNNREVYSQSFAYRTGSAYALLLDLEYKSKSKSNSWRTRVNSNSSLVDLLAEGMKYVISTEKKVALNRAESYGYTALKKQEASREGARRQRISHYRKLLLNGPTLKLPLAAMQYSYDPNTVFAFGEQGTVYPEARLSDKWGVLIAKAGLLISKDFTSAYVAAPAPSKLFSGAGWTIKLNPGWRIIPGVRSGDFIVARIE